MLSVENPPRELLVRINCLKVQLLPLPKVVFTVESQAFVREFLFVVPPINGDMIVMHVLGIGGGVLEGHGCQRYRPHQLGAEVAHGPV